MKSRTKYLIILAAILLAGEGWLVKRFFDRQRGAESQTAATTTDGFARPAEAAHCLDLSPHFNDSLEDGWQHQFDFESQMTRVAPFLIAVTAQ